MGLLDYTIKLIGLSETMHRWSGALSGLDGRRREKVARYAERIAETLGRAAAAFAALEKDPGSARAARQAVRELGRIAGYVEDIVRALEHHLDGRKASHDFRCQIRWLEQGGYQKVSGKSPGGLWNAGRRWMVGAPRG
jgi:hypothetical protein